ncbi:MAG: DNA topoisomerase I [archaeon]
MVELIITEKPKASQRIAEALADGKPIKESVKGVPYYKVTHGNQDIIVACAVGHLYTLAAKEKKSGFSFPVFDVEWKPSASVNKSSAFSKKYLDVIKKLSKEVSEFTIATDYDIEGEVIGHNVIKYACKQKDAARMKFSTLTKPDIVKAYEQKSKTIDWGQATAGETRHELDWYWGINMSRALTSSIKAIGKFKIMSIGRVQGPALKIVVDREREIKAFIPLSYWQLRLDGKIKDADIEAWHAADKFWKEAEAKKAHANTKGEDASVTKVDRREFTQAPPHPFDLTSLQIEAYRAIRVSPKETLSLAQEMYTSGHISYPRTSSQKLPPTIGYKKILEGLSKRDDYAELVSSLLSRSALKPNEGKKTDEAHPAIYPTGIVPKSLEGRGAKLYDLIVRRFMATFGDPAKRQTITLTITCGGEPFLAKGTTTLEKGWHIYYQPYLSLEEQEMPKVDVGTPVDVKKIEKLKKETQPPKRYTPASLIKDLEKQNLGTKATRASVIETLFDRNYVEGQSIGATDLGIKTIELLEKYSASIIDPALTRHFEDQLEVIREDITKRKDVLEEAKKALLDILDGFKDKEKEIGTALAEAHSETRTKAQTIGPCPKCTEGTLMIRMGKFGRFIACDKYPDCKTTFKLPAGGLIKPTEKICEQCKHPLILVIRKGKKPQELCINPECPSKQAESEGGEDLDGKPCPKCEKGTLVLRKSIYGQFFGCSNYPKCRHIVKK